MRHDPAVLAAAALHCTRDRLDGERLLVAIAERHPGVSKRSPGTIPKRAISSRLENIDAARIDLGGELLQRRIDAHQGQIVLQVIVHGWTREISAGLAALLLAAA